MLYLLGKRLQNKHRHRIISPFRNREPTTSAIKSFVRFLKNSLFISVRNVSNMLFEDIIGEFTCRSNPWDPIFLYRTPPVVQGYIKFVRMYTTPRRVWRIPTFYYTDRFRKWFLTLSVCLCMLLSYLRLTRLNFDEIRCVNPFWAKEELHWK